jgi:hypothetical protein
MDNKKIFVKTRKGEDEMHGRISQLPGDLKRALLMVDGSSTFSEISKRAAPSMRASLGTTFEELERKGLIQDKDMVGKSPRIAVPPKMSIPSKMVTPRKQQTADEGTGDLDFMSGYTPSPAEETKARSDKAEKVRAESEEISKQQIEAEKIKAKMEAEAIRLKAEQDAARIREVAARLAREEAEAARLKAEQEARKLREELHAPKLETGKDATQLLEDAIKGQQHEAEVKRSLSGQQAGKGREQTGSAKSKPGEDTQQRLEAAILEQQLAAEALRSLADKKVKKENDEIEAARLKIEQEAKLRLEAANRERERAEAARIKAEQEAEQIMLEMEMAKQKAEQEAKARQEAEIKARLEAEAKELARLKAEEEAARARKAAELARIKAAEEAAVAREAAALLARQEREAAAKEAAARAAEAREAAARAAKTIEDTPADEADGFAFDQFQIEEPQNPASLKDRPSAQKGSSRDTFAFDSFEIDEPQHAAEPPKSRRPEQISSSTLQPESARDAEDTSESAKDKHDNEQKIREEQERIAAEAEVRELADAIAKAEAEERSFEIARAKSEKAALHADYSISEPSRVEKPARIARVRRKPFAWGKLVGFVFKLGVFLIILLIAALFIIPYTLPMRDYMPKVQDLLSARLHQKVHLGNLSGRILPMPRLDLGEIYIGDAKQFQAVDAQINFDLMGLFTDAKPVSSVDFHGVKVRGPWVRDVAVWLQQLASQGQYPVSRMTISQGALDADAFQLAGMEGELNFNPAGKFTHADLRAEGGKYLIGLVASPGNKFQTTVTVRNSALPMLPNWSFDELIAKGELSNDQFLVKHFDATILGGDVQGDAAIDWRSGWHAQGTLRAKAIVMKNINKLVDGKIDGSAHFRMASSNLAGFADSALLDGSFKSGDGLLSGMDIVETARLHSKENLSGGRTHYDRLSGDISYSDGTYHFSQVKLDADVVDATAAFDVSQQQLSGKMNVKLSLRGLTAPVSLEMGGTTDSPTLLYSH